MHLLLRTATLAAVLAFSWGPPPLPAQQYPRARPGDFEVQGWDFRPDGAWRKQAQRVRAARRQLLATRNLATLNAPAAFGLLTRLGGTYNVPVVLIRFSNTNPNTVYTPAQYQDVLFNPAPTQRPYSVKTFYEQLSRGSITMQGSIFPPATVSQTDAYYENNCNGVGVLAPCVGGYSKFIQLLTEALDQASKGPDSLTAWAAFDNDGPDGIPNSGDDDGVVDFVNFIQPDEDGACNTQHIWAHRFSYSGLTGSEYVTRTPWAGHPGQFIKVDDYTMQSGVGGNNSCDPTSIMPIGTIAHETGHAFDLPDLYDTDINSPSHTEGIGEWGLMGSGNYARPYSPSQYDAWSLLELGWASLDTLSASSTVLINPIEQSDTVFYVPIANTDEYYLIENRQAVWSDSAQMSAAFTTHRKLPGLLVWHVNQDVVDAHGFHVDNRVNAGPVHGVVLLQADGRNDLGTPGLGNRGDVGDSYPGSTGNTRISALTNPSLTSSQGAFAGFAIDSIRQVVPNGAMSFRFLKRARSLVAGDHAGTSVTVNGTTYPRYDDIIAPGDQVAVDLDTLQSSTDGRSRFHFQSWSDGLPKAHRFTAGAAPDTVIAGFSAEYRAQVIVTGGGTVNSTLGQPLDGGAFLNAGQTFTLTAVAPPGLIFVNWSGDTTTTSDTLAIAMTHPFTETAAFATAVPISLAEATSQILGTARLSSAQLTFLDQIGNHNGSYDVGDFLAYLRLTGVEPAPARLARLFSRPSPQPSSVPAAGGHR